MKHTKGPWKTNQMAVSGLNTVFSPSHGPITTTYKESDARLIAAAPEMFGLLEKVSKLIDKDASGGQTYDSYVYASGIGSDIDRVLRKIRGEE